MRAEKPKYVMTDQEEQNLKNSYTYHAPKDDQPQRYVIIRDKALELAIMICENCPPSRERSIALTDLEKVVTMANKSIACNE